MRKLVVHKKSIVFAYLIILVSLSSLVRSGVNYIDDNSRVLRGHAGWEDFGRYISNILSLFIHGNTYLADVSPIGQLIAILFMALSAVAMVVVFYGVDFKMWHLLASLVACVSPHFMQCYAFKYDSPYMALSVLAMIVPFLYLETNKGFVIASLIGTLMMCMTYQTSSCVYPLMVLFLAFKTWNEEKIDTSFIKKMIMGFFSYLLVMAVFYVGVASTNPGYTDTTVSNDGLIYRTVSHYFTYLKKLYIDYNSTWKVIAIVIAVCFVVISIKISRKNKIVAFFAASATVVMGLFLAFGVYPFITSPTYAPRSMYGFEMYLALLAIGAVSCDRAYIPKVCVAATVWLFTVFGLIFGNALKEQSRYTEFRLTVLASDVANLELFNEIQYPRIIIRGNIGKSKVVRNLESHFHLISDLVPDTLSGEGFWNQTYFRRYFSIPNCETEDGEVDGAIVLKDNLYHCISVAGDDVIVIELKQPKDEE